MYLKQPGPKQVFPSLFLRLGLEPEPIILYFLRVVGMCQPLALSLLVWVFMAV